MCLSVMSLNLESQTVKKGGDTLQTEPRHQKCHAMCGIFGVSSLNSNQIYSKDTHQSLTGLHYKNFVHPLLVFLQD
jgi:hypothetical protein